jgi:NAD(P)H-hydrate epimerase
MAADKRSRSGRRPRPEQLPLYTAEQMRRADAAAIKHLSIPGAVLMERAGMAVAEFILERFGAQEPFVVLAGKGNNGGDGFVVARHLYNTGADVRVLTVAPAAQYRGDALTNLRTIKKMGVPILSAPEGAALRRELTGVCVIVDAIFGTGFSGEPHGPAAWFIAEAARAAAERHNPVVAVDIASGVDASTGEMAGVCLPADATVTFHMPKVGHFVAPGGYFCGDLILADIGIPEDAGPEGEHFLADAEAVAETIPPKIEPDNKFSAGSVLVAGGSTGLTGAACMAAESALRTGAGVVTCAVPATLNAIFEQKLLEVMTLPVDDTGDGHLALEALGPILEAAEKVDCLALGPGLGRRPEGAALTEALLERCDMPVVLDADGLNAMAGKLARMKRREAATIITPHEGELARLLGANPVDVAARRLFHARQAAKKSGAVVVLKGAATIITDGDWVVVNPTGNPGLATAGSGDVLTGAIAALVARGMEPFEAAVAATYIHGAAADLAATDLYQDNLIASDLIDYLPLALAALKERGHEDEEPEEDGHSCSCGH